MISRRLHAVRSRGFSLVEALGCIVILSIVGLTGARIVLVAGAGVSNASERARLHGELTMALDRVARALRSIPAEEDTNAADVTALSGGSITWGPGMGAGGGGGVRVENGDLLLTTGTEDETLLTGVVSLTFAATDESANTVALPVGDAGADAIRYITVTISATHGETTETVRTGVFLRASALALGRPD